MSHAFTCPSKRGYRTKAYAKLMVRRYQGSRVGLTPYRCTHCGAYHIGHRPGSKKAAA